MDIISIEGMEFHAFIGCFSEEKIIGTRFIVDVYMTLDATTAKKNDSLANTVNYQLVYSVIKKIMNEKCDLLEHTVHKILISIIENFSLVENVRCKVKKMNPPLGGQIGYVSFESELER